MHWRYRYTARYISDALILNRQAHDAAYCRPRCERELCTDMYNVTI